jgi:hypothetical protein
MVDISDLRSTIVPKSDQLNAEQLLGGPMTVVITDVTGGSSAEQPVSVHYEGENGRPYKPCKTMRKALIFAWGPDGREWIGRAMELYCDPAVKFGGEEVGGIRISAMSHIERDIQLSLTATRGKKALCTIKKLVIKTGPTLDQVLQAISSASNKASMDAAKAMAKELTRATDIAAAQEAYKARVAALKAAPAPKKTLAQFTEEVDSAADQDTADMVLVEAKAVLSAEDYTTLEQSHKLAWTEA